MADFIRFQANGKHVLVNAEQITCVGHKVEYVNNDIPVFYENSTIISFSGDTDNYIVIDEPFEEVCTKLTRVR